MPNFKELIVVLGISAIAFIWLKPIALQFSAEADFARRRNLWLVLTIIAFLSPNIWVYAILAAPLMVWGGRRDSNPIALYLVLLHVIPPISIPIPFPGISLLFDFQNYRLLALCVLIPTVWRIRRDRAEGEVRGWQGMDLLLLGFGALQTLLFIRPDIPTAALLHDSSTNMLRRLFLFVIDIYVLYYAVSRSSASKAKIVDAMAAFCVVSCVMALEAVFETVRHWLLYQALALDLNPGDTGMLMAYLMRNGVVRAQAAAGHALALGYLLAVAFGFWLYLRPHIESRLRRISILIVLWAGLFATYSRGPWIGAIAIYCATIALDPKDFGKLARTAAALIVAAGVIALTPLGPRIVAVLPFMGGSVDLGNLEYRQRLASASWNLILNHPYFGDPDFISKMKELRQGQGIIDLVNTYAGTALEYGLVGLALFVGFILLGMLKGFKAMIRIGKTDVELARLGSCILACIAGTLLMIYNCSFIFGYEKMFYVLAGLATAYWRICSAPQAVPLASGEVSTSIPGNAMASGYSS
jgi:hypothetical protein